jgi:hypothetical protein
VKPSKEQLDFCIAQLSRFIPSPPRPAAKARKSKWGAKVGEGYISIEDGFAEAVKPWLVVGTDSLGITLEKADGTVARIESNEDFKTRFAKLRRPRAKQRRVSDADEPAPLLSGGV